MWHFSEKVAKTSRNLQPFLTLLRSKFGTGSKVEVVFLVVVAWAYF